MADQDLATERVRLIDRWNWGPFLTPVVEYIERVAAAVMQRPVQVNICRNWKVRGHVICGPDAGLTFNYSRLQPHWFVGPVENINLERCRRPYWPDELPSRFALEDPGRHSGLIRVRSRQKLAPNHGVRPVQLKRRWGCDRAGQHPCSQAGEPLAVGDRIRVRRILMGQAEEHQLRSSLRKVTCGSRRWLSRRAPDQMTTMDSYS